AFILSAIGMIFPSSSHKPNIFAWDVFFSISSLLILIVGSYWFYPTARFAFRLKILEMYENSLDDVFPERKAEGGSAEPGVKPGETAKTRKTSLLTGSRKIIRTQRKRLI